MLLKATEKGSAQVMEALNTDNAKANLALKRKRVDKPEIGGDAKRPLEDKSSVMADAEAEDSYEF